jgi:hypothetical protein
MNDDDLPVLTQVLRTGSGRREAPIAAPAESVHEPFEDALDVRPIDETWMAEQLVIGNEPGRRIDDYLMTPFGERDPAVATQAGEANGESGRQRDDGFPLTNDHDVVDRDAGGTLGEPHLPDVVDARPAEPPPPMPAGDRAALALQVRDAVLEDLRTRIDTELDARIAQAMYAELETAVAQLQINLRTQLTAALRDVVQRAVDEEIARIAGAAQASDAV